MAIEFQQMLLLPSVTYGNDLQGGVEALVTGSDDDNAIAIKCEAEFPTTITLRNEGVDTLVFRHNIALRQEAKEVWKATAKYKAREPRSRDARENSADPGQRTAFDIQFDIGTTQRLMKYGLSVAGRYPVSQAITLTDYGAAINIDSNKVVRGANIETPTMSFSETHYLPQSSITDSYLRTMYKLVGTVNSSTTRGFAAGELLLQRITGNKRNNEQWQISYAWAYQENIANEPLNGATVTKKGWHYMWEESEVTEDAATQDIAPELLGYHVIQVYKEKDHNVLEGVAA